jgi:hypothetical protein
VCEGGVRRGRVGGRNYFIQTISVIRYERGVTSTTLGRSEIATAVPLYVFSAVHEPN